MADGTANGTIAANLPTGLVTYSNTVPGASDLQKTSAVMENGAGAYAWEMALANGSYQVKIAIGDTSGDPSSSAAVSPSPSQRRQPAGPAARPERNESSQRQPPPMTTARAQTAEFILFTYGPIIFRDQLSHLMKFWFFS